MSLSPIDEILEDIMLFSPDILELQGPVEQAKVDEFEKNYKISLPNDYKEMIAKHNGLSLMGTTIYGIYDKSTSGSLEEFFWFEHFEVGNPMPQNLIPFSPDGGGNHYCFNIGTCNEKSCKIVFWQHDYLYSDSDLPEIVNYSFPAWFREVVVDWTLEGYDYNGNPKR